MNEITKICKMSFPKAILNENILVDASYNWMPSWYRTIWHDIAYITPATEAKYKQEFKPTKDTPYLALAGKLWGVFCENLRENQPRINGTAQCVAASPKGQI